MSEQNERSFLEERRADLLAELRRREPELVAKFLMVTELIEEFDSAEDVETPKPEKASETLEYSDPKLSKPFDAIEAYLDKAGKPTPREIVAKSLAKAGWGKGRVKKPYRNLLSMLDYHFGPIYKSEPRFKEINGLLGRIGWPDEEFTPPALPEAIPETQRERPIPKD